MHASRHASASGNFFENVCNVLNWLARRTSVWDERDMYRLPSECLGWVPIVSENDSSNARGQFGGMCAACVVARAMGVWCVCMFLKSRGTIKNRVGRVYTEVSFEC